MRNSAGTSWSVVTEYPGVPGGPDRLYVGRARQVTRSVLVRVGTYRPAVLVAYA